LVRKGIQSAYILGSLFLTLVNTDDFIFGGHDAASLGNFEGTQGYKNVGNQSPSDVVSCRRKGGPHPRHHENVEDLPNKYSCDLVVLVSHIIVT
jgi:hypothetical protein